MAFNPEDNCLAEQFRLIFNTESDDDDLSIITKRFVEAAIAHDPGVIFDLAADDYIKLVFSDGSSVCYAGPKTEVKPLLH